jgi:chromosome segregation ATPase
MTIDERLDRLTERHEALTQSVELLALQGKETDRRIDQVMQAIEKLVHIVSSHEQRLDRLEGLEGA